MKEKRLLYAIGWVDGRYIEELENDSAAQHKPKRVWLLAAVIAALLLLAGCVAAVSWLNKRSIGQETYTQRFDAQGHYIEPTEKTADTVTLFGSVGSNMQKALAAWNDFRKNYPVSYDLALMDEDYAKIPEQYSYIYNCYTPEMVEKLNKITQKYHLQLLETKIGFQRSQYQAVLDGLGLTSVLRPQGDVCMENRGGGGGLCPPRNLDMEFFADIPEIKESWARNIFIEYTYADTGYFPGFGTATVDLSEYTQWKYTAADGTPLLLALNSKGKGIILAERPDATITIQVDSNFSGPNFPKPEEVMDQAGLEKLADGFDYTITPQAVDVPALQKSLSDIWEADNQALLDSVKKYSSFTDYLLREGHRVSKANYYFRDLDGNGIEEMILEFPSSEITYVLSVYENQVYEYMMIGRICILENGGLMTSQDQYGKEMYWFHLPQENGYPFSITYEGFTAGLHIGDIDTTIWQENGVWWESGPNGYGGNKISDDRAEEIFSQHKEVSITSTRLPLWDYPIDETGKTLGQELSSRKNPTTVEDAQAFFAQAIQENQIRPGKTTQYYCLRDINGDGTMDILFSPDGKKASWSYLSRYGKAAYFSSSITGLTEDYVYIDQGNGSAEDGADLAYYKYFVRGDSSADTLAEFQCNLANGQWTNLLTGDPMSEAEAQAIIDRYPPLVLDMHPIQELTEQ